MGTTYFVAPGARFTGNDAQVLGECFVALAENQELSPEAVLKEAQRDTSPLHRFFEWGDAEAANLYRRGQALYYMRNIRVQFVEGEEPIKAIHRIVIEPEEGEESTAQYVTIDMAAREAEWMAQIIERERQELIGCQRRLRQYRHIAEVEQVTEGPLQDAITKLERVAA